MPQTATIQIKLDPQLKQDANNLFSGMGLTTVDAIKLFLKQSLNTNSIPFEIKPVPYFSDAEREEIAQAIINIENGEYIELTPDMSVEEFFANM